MFIFITKNFDKVYAFLLVKDYDAWGVVNLLNLRIDNYVLQDIVIACLGLSTFTPRYHLRVS